MPATKLLALIIGGSGAIGLEFAKVFALVAKFVPDAWSGQRLE